MILEVEHISGEYSEGNPIFQDVNFNVKEGEILGIVGPSGVGKSTLLKCLANLLPISKGVIKIEGEKLVDPRQLLKPGHPEIALVNQVFKLDEFFTVRENLATHLHHLSEEVREDFIQELLQIFELEELSDFKSKDISGGEQQRLSMACALAKEPRCLLLDEPFVHFDVHLSKKIGHYLRNLVKARQMGLILVTHNGAEALAWSDRILILREKRISSQYTPEKAYFNPKSLYEGRFFGELNSIYFEGKQILFRPTEYVLKPEKDTIQIDVEWNYSSFRGPYFANYFTQLNGREIVLYSTDKLEEISTVYVKKSK